MIIITIFSLLLIYSFPFLKTSINTILFRRICAISFIYASVLSFNTFYIQSIGSGVGLYSGLFEINILSLFISFFILIISSIILLVWPDLTYHVKFTKNKNLEEEYCLIVLFSLLGALFLVNSSDLLSMYLSIELQSFGLYILASLYKDKLSATSAGLKYFLLGGLSSCIILLGCGLIYSYTGLTNLESIYNFISVYYCEEQISNWKGLFSLDLSTIFNHSTLQETGLNSHLSDTLVLSKDGNQWQGIGVGLGLIFIFSGFLFKIAASPFHNWAPDVYDDSPTIITTWLSIMPKISILIFLLELQIGFDSLLNFDFLINAGEMPLTEERGIIHILTSLLLLSSLLSLLIGAILGLSQIRIKRLLAYSTINHIGFLLLSLAVFSNSSIEAFIFYIVQYTLTNLNIFLILLALGYITNFEIKEAVTPLSRQNMKLSSRMQVAIGKKTTSPAHSTLWAVDGGEEKRENGSRNLIMSKLPISSLVVSVSDIEYIKSLKGLFFINPLLSISLSISLFSLAGVPPLIGFFAKQQVLYSSNSAGYFFLSLIAILVSVISAYYYLKIIKIINTSSSTQPISNSLVLSSLNVGQGEKEIENQILSNIHCFIISVLTLIIVLFIFNPEILLNTIAILTSLIINI